MAEKPPPSVILVGEVLDWARKKVIEANSGRYSELVYKAYNRLVDVFLARRLLVASQIETEGGVDYLSEQRGNNG